LKKNILIATGGSGGHIVPATVFYNHLKKKFNIYLSSDLRGLNYIDKKNYNIEIVETPNIFNNFFLIPVKLFIVLVLSIKSIFFLRNKKIDVILSTGGYAPTPICLAGIFLKLKLYIYEPNHVLGKSNKFFLKYCDKIFCQKKHIKNFKNKFKKKIFLLSPLVRKSFYKNKFRKDKRFNLMVIGGSQSAKIFDEYLHKVFLKISKKIDIKIFHQTKINNINNLKKFYNKGGIKNKVFNFDKNFLNSLKKCSFCITRAGASTLAELFILNIPFLAIPLPGSKDNHQYENAKYYEDKNCCWIEDERKINEEKLYRLLKNIILKKKELLKKKKLLNKLNKNISWNNQTKIIIKELNEN
tara:strand:- start:344 stop:1408 length:1065 start_codon:yes stop_codon:yes gene_type:complete